MGSAQFAVVANWQIESASTLPWDAHEVGDAVGERVGVCVGMRVGDSVGVGVGAGVGDGVGDGVGLIDPPAHSGVVGGRGSGTMPPGQHVPQYCTSTLAVALSGSLFPQQSLGYAMLSLWQNSGVGSVVAGEAPSLSPEPESVGLGVGSVVAGEAVVVVGSSVVVVTTMCVGDVVGDLVGAAVGLHALQSDGHEDRSPASAAQEATAVIRKPWQNVGSARPLHSPVG